MLFMRARHNLKDKTKYAFTRKKGLKMHGYGFGYGPAHGFGFPRGLPFGFQPRNNHFWFIDCNDAPVLQKLTAAYRPLEEALNNAEYSLWVHKQWKHDHERSLDSRALLSSRNENAMRNLETNHYGLLSARLTLAVCHAALLKSTQELQAVIADYLKNDVESSFAHAVHQGSRGRDLNAPPLQPYHLEVFRMNVNVASMVLERAFSVLASPEFEDLKVENQLPGTLKDLLGNRMVIADLPPLPVRQNGYGHTFQGIVTWFKELLAGKTQMPWGPAKEGYGFPEATGKAFSNAGWNVERVETTEAQRAEGAKTHYVLTPPAPGQTAK